MWAKLKINFSFLFANWCKDKYDSSCVEYLADVSHHLLKTVVFLMTFVYCLFPSSLYTRDGST